MTLARYQITLDDPVAASVQHQHFAVPRGAVLKYVSAGSTAWQAVVKDIIFYVYDGEVSAVPASTDDASKVIWYRTHHYATSVGLLWRGFNEVVECPIVSGTLTLLLSTPDTDIGFVWLTAAVEIASFYDPKEKTVLGV